MFRYYGYETVCFDRFKSRVLKATRPAPEPDVFYCLGKVLLHVVQCVHGASAGVVHIEGCDEKK
jgi:hypothetical protein